MAWQDNLVCAARRTLGAEKGAGQAGLSKATCQEQTPENQTPPPQSSTVPKIPPPTCWGTRVLNLSPWGPFEIRVLPQVKINPPPVFSLRLESDSFPRASSFSSWLPSVLERQQKQRTS